MRHHGTSSLTGAWRMVLDHQADWLTISEAARLLKVSRGTLARWLRTGRLPSYHVGPKAVRIRRGDLAAVVTPVRRDAVQPTEDPMSTEQLKHTLTTAPTAEELARRQAVVARTLDHRTDLVI